MNTHFVTLYFISDYKMNFQTFNKRYKPMKTHNYCRHQPTNLRLFLGNN